MWGYYYSQIARKPTTSAASPPPPTSPTFSASTESPPNTFTPANSSFPDPHPTSPHTPINQDSLQRIEDTGGSRAPLVARDFAHQSEGEGSSSRSIRLHQASQFPSIPTLTSPPSPKSKPIDPLLIPPPSVHDAYLSNLIVPLNPDRPPIVRANSAPGSGAPHTSLLPSAIPGTASDEGKPIFEIFNAELNTPAEEMVKVLKEHLEGVLKMQEEIGRMHLGLEKLDLTGEVPEEENVEVDGADGLGKREKAVDDIMERVYRPFLRLCV